ncbi:MAG: putative transport system ATP-binding protein [Acidimicrobiaceae bacterium]
MTVTPDRAPLASCTDASRSFGRGPRAVVAVHGVTCHVWSNDAIALVGPSGSGKSTLLHLLAGLDGPTTGTVTWPALGDRADLRPGKVGIVLQGPSLLAPLDVADNVALPLLILGVDRADAYRAAHDALAQLELDALAAHLPEELSSGQAQRVAVARVIAAHPQLILADEPTGQVDHVSAVRIIDALVATATETGAALVVATHDPSIADRLQSHWTVTDGHLERDAASCLR